ncbi:hypothetical protein ABK040_013386 [Willaertia magna]
MTIITEEDGLVLNAAEQGYNTVDVDSTYDNDLYPSLNNNVPTNFSNNNNDKTIKRPKQGLQTKIMERYTKGNFTVVESLALGGIGGYISGQIVRIGSRVVFGGIAATLLLISSYSHVKKNLQQQSEQQVNNDEMQLSTTNVNKENANNAMNQYEMIAKIGIAAANEKIKNFNFKDWMISQWRRFRNIGRDNYYFTSSYLIGFIISMF